MKTFYFIPVLLVGVFISGLLAGWRYIDGLTLGLSNISLLVLMTLALLVILYYIESKFGKLYLIISGLVLSLFIAVISTNLYKKLPILSGSVVDSNFHVQGIIWIICFLAVIRYHRIFNILAVFSLSFVLVDVLSQVFIHGSGSGYFHDRVISKQAVFSKNKKNIALIIIDTARSDVFNDALIRANIDGLKVYDNYYSNYSSTFTSVPFNLSGIPPVGMTFSEYSKKFVCNNVQSVLLKEGWDVYNFPYEYLKQTLPIRPCNTSHIDSSSMSVDQGLVNKFWIAMNVYLYKQNVGNVFGRWSPLKEEVENKSKSDDVKFKEMLDSQVSYTRKNVFAFYHFNGLHAPVNKKNENSSVVEDYHARSSEIAFSIKKFVLMLKKKGVSRDTQIIIMGDHGAFIPQLSYGQIKIESSDGETKIIKFNNKSVQGGKIGAIYGDELFLSYFMDVVKNSGINDVSFEMIKPLVLRDSGWSEYALHLSKAALAIISLDDKNISHVNVNVFTGFVRNFIFDYAMKKKGEDESNIVYVTPFSGNLDNKKIIYLTRCSVNEGVFSCDPSGGSIKNPIFNIANEKIRSQGHQYVNVALYEYPEKWSKACNFKPRLGTNMYQIDVLDCLIKVPANVANIYPTFKFNNFEISNVSVDAGGVRALIGFDVVIKRSSIADRYLYGKFSSMVGGHAVGSYIVKSCSLKNRISIPSSVIFEINDKQSSDCNTVTISNSNPLVPSLEEKFSKDARIINSQLVALEGGSKFKDDLAGISYPDENDGHVKWIASFPFKIFNSICSKNLKIEFFPSRTGAVTLKGYKDNKLVYNNTIRKDGFYDYTQEICHKHKGAQEIVVSSQKDFFVLPEDRRVYAALLHLE